MTLEEKINKAFDGNIEKVNGGVGVYTSQFIQEVLSICQQEIDEAYKRDSIILTTDQICQIAGFAGLNIDNPNLDEFEIEYTIDKSDKGLFVWTTEYPEEGSVNLESPKENIMNFTQKIPHRVGDLHVEHLTDIEIIEELYKQLWKSNEIINKIKATVTGSWGTKDQTDHNMEILNPLYNEAKARKWI